MTATNRVFTVENFHTQQCGRPPSIHDDGKSTQYRGYFVNPYGEQWLVTIDRAAKSGVLRGGDIGWDREIQIIGGNVDEEYILGPEELQWLDACWQAACGEPLS